MTSPARAVTVAFSGHFNSSFCESQDAGGNAREPSRVSSQKSHAPVAMDVQHVTSLRLSWPRVAMFLLMRGVF